MVENLQPKCIGTETKMEQVHVHCPSLQLCGHSLSHVNVSSVQSHCGFSPFYLHNERKVFLQNLQLMKFILKRETLDFSCLSQTHQGASSPGEHPPLKNVFARSLRERDDLFDQKICNITINLDGMISVTLHFH